MTNASIRRNVTLVESVCTLGAIAFLREDPVEVTCLSIPNPRSYLVCAGIADVENRGIMTEYRGTLYIHSTGRFGFRGMPDMSAYPVPVIHEFNDYLARIQDMVKAGRYIAIPDAGVRVTLKNEHTQSEQAFAEYTLLAEAYAAYRRDPTEIFFHVKALIGTVDLVDVVEGSTSPWAAAGSKHWVFANPTLFAEPITGVVANRSGLWTFDVPE
jgi:hypothetical protein